MAIVVLCVGAVVAPGLLAPGARWVSAAPLGTTIPPNCVRHTSFNGGADVSGDYRCAGLPLQFHTAGVASSPFPIWAGQWLFTDETGQFRVGYCTTNRASHPTIAVRSQVVSQTWPLDPTGRRTSYLAWAYGDTGDPLTAAAVWAVFHYFAQDDAGSNRAADPTAPLVPRLDRLQSYSGRFDLQVKAVDLYNEALARSGEWTLDVGLQSSGTATVTLLAGSAPVPGRTVTLHVSGSDLPVAVTTGPDGRATVEVPIVPGTTTVVATTEAPGRALVYRGWPASPDPRGAQFLVTAGTPATLRAEAALAPPPTTAPTTTTTVAPTTSAPSTSEASTTTQPPITLPPETVPPEVETTVTEPPFDTIPFDTIPFDTFPFETVPDLPETGQGADGAIPFVATALLVSGIGVVGTLRRREVGSYTR